MPTLAALQRQAASLAVRAVQIGYKLSWRFGAYKKAQEWAKQLVRGNWTPNKINATIKRGRKLEALSKPNNNNPATQYFDEATGRFVVIDDLTKEIIQVSRPAMKPNLPIQKD